MPPTVTPGGGLEMHILASIIKCVNNFKNLYTIIIINYNPIIVIGMFLRSCNRKRGLTVLIRFKGIVDFIPGKERRKKFVLRNCVYHLFTLKPD